MKKTLIASLVGSFFGLGLALPVSAFAQAKGNAPASAPAPTQRVKNVSIEEDQIVGELTQPNLDMHTARGTVVPGSLIRVRGDFVPEIVKSSQDVR
jgi:hypothetical protein